MNKQLTQSRIRAFGLLLFFIAFSFSISFSVVKGDKKDSLTTVLSSFLQTDTSGVAGILFGRLDSLNTNARIWTEGAIDEKNDLRLGCPTSKPCLAFIVLKERIDLGTTIDRWFPEDSGFTKSHVITINHLLLNSSGIRDYVPLIPIHSDSAITPTNSIDCAYRNQPLLFSPGTGFEYSNTNFNIVGRILELHTGKTVQQLFRQYFGAYAVSLRIDDGKGNYPRGYPKPWPYHWISPGYAGGFIGSATDAMRTFAYISTQPEFKIMTRWYSAGGSVSDETSDHLLGLGVFGKSNFAGLGEAVVYEGNMGPCQMILARVRGSIFYIASAHNIGPSQLSDLFQRLIVLSIQYP
ncbi:MAG: beta-lactamase family protein [Ignavibacteria bacterium]|nr:beta-lactamase family protein [Ignavibacteria bacterium]